MDNERIEEIRPDLHSAFVYITLLEKIHKAGLAEQEAFDFAWFETNSEIRSYIDEIAYIHGEISDSSSELCCWVFGHNENQSPACIYIDKLFHDAKNEVDRKWKSVV